MLESILQLKDLINNESFYWFCALVGSGMFVIQFTLNLIGFGDGIDGTEGGWGQALQVKWISKQALTGFIMMFGWTALTCLKEFGMEGPAVLILSFLAGLVAFLATGLLFKIAQSLNSPGTQFKIEEAIGKEAVVYQRIPKGGAGKITINLDDMTREVDALSHNDDEVPSFTRVQVIKRADANTVVVKKL